MLLRTPFIAGFIAAVGSVVGKLSSDPDTWFSRLMEDVCQSQAWVRDGVGCTSWLAGARAACFVLMIALNGVGVNLFVRAMHETSTLVATVTQSSVNFTCSALFGLLLFGEPLPLQWWIGMSCMAAGVALLSGTTDDATDARVEEAGKKQE